jgi:hypothetical protein
MDKQTEKYLGDILSVLKEILQKLTLILADLEGLKKK